MKRKNGKCPMCQEIKRIDWHGHCVDCEKKLMEEETNSRLLSNMKWRMERTLPIFGDMV